MHKKTYITLKYIILHCYYMHINELLEINYLIIHLYVYLHKQFIFYKHIFFYMTQYNYYLKLFHKLLRNILKMLMCERCDYKI